MISICSTQEREREMICGQGVRLGPDTERGTLEGCPTVGSTSFDTTLANKMCYEMLLVSICSLHTAIT